MPAKTTEQLQDTHSQYLDAADTTNLSRFWDALNEVMPRIYKMGYWREMLVEHTQDASDGYISLPQDTDSIVAAVLDNNATPTRSLWHDYKLFGTNDQDTTVLGSFIDDGHATTYRDLVSGSKYKIQFHTMKGPSYATAPSKGSITVKYRRYGDAAAASGALIAGDTKLEGDSYSEASTTFTGQSGGPSDIIIYGDITGVLSITWDNLETAHPIQVSAKYNGTDSGANTEDSTKDLILAQINTEHGASRYRRYRIGNTNSDSTAHMLLKRRWVDVDSGSDLVHIPSSAILKHALLGKLSEDNADAQRAMYHWGVVKELLEADTDSYRGSAKPTLHIAPDGVGAGMSGMY